MRSLKKIASSLACALVLSACASQSSVRFVQPRKIQADPLPPELAAKDTPNLVATVRSSWSTSSSAATSPSASTQK